MLNSLKSIFKREKKQGFSETIDKLEKLFCFKITNSHYYLKALTHRSYIEYESELQNSNERLEYLGDAVLGLVVGKFLFTEFPGKDEGFLTKTRSRLVYKDALSEAAFRIGLDNLLFYKKNFLQDSKEGLKTIIADAMEAIIGAIFLDRGLEAASSFIYTNIIAPNLINEKFKIDRNFKGKLLETAHRNEVEQPEYHIVDQTGPEHDKLFTVAVYISGKECGRGIGKSKKAAEQMAAHKALIYFENNPIIQDS